MLYVKEYYNVLGVFCSETITNKQNKDTLPLILTVSEAYDLVDQQRPFYFWGINKTLIYVKSSDDLDERKNMKQLINKKLCEFSKLSLKQALKMLAEYRKRS